MHESYSHDVSLRDIEAAYKEIYSMGDKPVELIKRIERSITKLDDWKFDFPKNGTLNILVEAHTKLMQISEIFHMNDKTKMKYLAVFFIMILKSIKSKLHRTIFIRYIFSTLIADELAEEHTEYYKQLSSAIKPITEGKTSDGEHNDMKYDIICNVSRDTLERYLNARGYKIIDNKVVPPIN